MLSLLHSGFSFSFFNLNATFSFLFLVAFVNWMILLFLEHMLASAATNGSVVIWNLSRQVKSKQGNTSVIADLIVMNQNHH